MWNRSEQVVIYTVEPLCTHERYSFLFRRSFFALPLLAAFCSVSTIISSFLRTFLHTCGPWCFLKTTFSVSCLNSQVFMVNTTCCYIDLWYIICYLPALVGSYWKNSTRGHESCVCMTMHGVPLDASGSRSCAKTIQTSYIPYEKISYNKRKKRSNSTVEETIVNKHVKGVEVLKYIVLPYTSKRKLTSRVFFFFFLFLFFLFFVFVFLFFLFCGL